MGSRQYGGSTQTNVRYHKMDKSPRGNGEWLDLQFERKPRPFPTKSVVFATCLFLLGSTLIIMASLMLAGIIIPHEYGDRMWPLLVLGMITFLPGFYHVRIAYYAWKGQPGYTYDDIPDFQ